MQPNSAGHPGKSYVLQSCSRHGRQRDHPARSREIGLPEPEVRHYSSVAEAVSDFPAWRNKASPLVATYWKYQYPILNPNGYWASHHLYREGFQFDLTRSRNQHGCYVYPHYKSQIPIAPNLLFHRYLIAAIDAVRDNPEDEFDVAVRRTETEHERFFEELMGVLDREEPSNQMGVSDYVLLGGFRWMRIERDISCWDLRAWTSLPACDEHYQNVRLLCESDLLFFTFRNLVLSARIPAGDRDQQ